MDGLCLRAGLQGITPPISAAAGGVFRAAAPERFSFFNHPVNSVFSGAKNGVGMIKGVAIDDAVLMERSEVDQGNNDLPSPSCSSSKACDDEDGNENEVEFDRNSFSEMLKKVSLSDAQLYAQMCYLANLAYAIPTIKPGNFKRQCGLRYVTSSIEKPIGDDLDSISLWPCDWYICDDDESATRFFVIQGSETLASWQANLLIEPVQFEGTDFYVHRGIYEAAKGMYQQMLPEIQAHTKAHGTQAKLRFTGHSLGGSLSLLINLMLLARGQVPLSSLLPVITFGSPTVMCKGDKLLSELGLPRSHVQAITMHRDIVPRVFSCHYPCHVVELLKAVNGNFRNHPCLNKQKLLYASMGEMIILQPDSSFSPKHDLLPSGSGLYLLRCSSSDANEAKKQLRAAQSVFLNTPHPLEIISDQSAYGNGGTIQRDHEMKSYLKCVRSVLRQELNRINKAEREQRWKAWWPLVSPRVVSGQKAVVGSGSLKRLIRVVTSQHMHLLVVLMFPVRMLLMGLHQSG